MGESRAMVVDLLVVLPTTRVEGYQLILARGLVATGKPREAPRRSVEFGCTRWVLCARCLAVLHRNVRRSVASQTPVHIFLPNIPRTGTFSL